MDNVVDFSRLEDEPLIGSFIKEDVESIHKLAVEKDLTALTLALHKLRDKLISHCNKNKIHLKNYPYTETAKLYFSHFLQYFFYTILKIDLTAEYKKQLLSHLLTIDRDNFYYSFTFHNQKIIATWIDKDTGDTALTAIAQQNEPEILDELLATLKNTLAAESSGHGVFPALDHYLFHENNLGRSALTLIWLKKNRAMESRLFKFASIYYKEVYSETFKRFLFQIDSEGNTALMRAASRGLTRLFPLILNNLSRIFLKKNH